MIKLLVFDLDGTLADSKAALDGEMADRLSALLRVVKVAIISGGSWTQFQEQVLGHLPPGDYLSGLSLLPTCGTRFYDYAPTPGWQLRYADDFTDPQRTQILAVLNRVIDQSGFRATKPWGELIEDRGSQITFSGLGQQAPLPQKAQWDPNRAKRTAIKTRLDSLLPDMSIRLGGATSIDITRPGIDKAYGILKLRDLLTIAVGEMLFAGDALFLGGNDYPVKTVGVTAIPVRDPTETKRIIETVIACLGS